MKETEQRIAIAEACGWTKVKIRLTPDDHEILCGLIPDAEMMDSQGADSRYFKLPDYLNDLNSMHEAINTLSGNDLEKFANELARITYGGGEWHGDFTTLTVMEMLQATAAQHARAFLETLGLWKP